LELEDIEDSEARSDYLHQVCLSANVAKVWDPVEQVKLETPGKFLAFAFRVCTIVTAFTNTEGALHATTLTLFYILFKTLRLFYTDSAKRHFRRFMGIYIRVTYFLACLAASEHLFQ